MKTGPKKKNLLGYKFGRWVVIAEVPNVDKKQFWRCRCTCGEERNVMTFTLKNGTSQSCGCAQKEGGETATNYRHGKIKSGMYQSWVGMRARCSNPKGKNFHNYGGRGITVCDRWQDFESFWIDMHATWKPGLSVERKDVNGNYDPENCIWATQYEQMQNLRHAVYLDTPWGKLTKGATARKIGISTGGLNHRLSHGWKAPEIFEKNGRKNAA